MKIKNLYRYKGENGTVDTVVLLPMEHEEMLRIEAENGKVLTDGKIFVTIRDIPAEEFGLWTEIDKPVVDEGEESEVE